MPTWSTSSIVTPAVNRDSFDRLKGKQQCLKRLKRSSSTASDQLSVFDNRRRRIPVIRINTQYDHLVFLSKLLVRASKGGNEVGSNAVASLGPPFDDATLG